MKVYILKRYAPDSGRTGTVEVLGVFAEEANARKAGACFANGYWRTSVVEYTLGEIPERFGKSLELFRKGIFSTRGF